MNNSIYVVTDGSSISANNSKGFDAAAAYVIYVNGKIVHKESILLRNHTNNYAEMYAIYKGTKYVLENMVEIHDCNNVVIITDSQLCEKSLNEWMKGWLKKATDETLMSTTGEVKNQELIKSAYINILSLQLFIPVYICHINSHNNESKILHMHKKFIDKYFDIDLETFKMIFEGNQIVDKMAYEKLN